MNRPPEMANQSIRCSFAANVPKPGKIIVKTRPIPLGPVIARFALIDKFR
jgi:hypothetical protein